MATEIANAYVSITTKMPNIKADLTKALSGSDASSALASSGSKMGSFLTGAIGGAAALGLSKVVSTVMGSIDSAIKRVDTLNNFPKIMQNLGYSATDAQKSIDKISKGLEGLPTALDGMAGTVQQLAPLTGSLDEATNLSLALNNALLAGGKSTEVQANAMQQYAQQLAAGKVDAAAWQSMLDAMPGQLNQVAQSLLGADANQKDLYDAMKGGKVTFDQFNGAILDLNKNGTGAYASFEKQAKDATDGIATSQANLNTAITRGMAKLIEKMQPAIAALLGGLTSLANDGFNVLAGALDWIAQNADIVIPVIAGLGGVLLTAVAPAIWAAVTATWAWTAALLANPLTWVALAIGAVIAAAVALVANWDKIIAWINKNLPWLAEAWNNVVSFITTIWANFTRFLGEAWANISAFFTAAWENVISPVFNAIADIAVWVYETILKPVFDGIAAVVGFLAAAFKIHFDAIVIAFRVVGAIVNWLWLNVISPVFNFIGGIVQWVWTTIISPIFAAIGGALKILGDAFNWLWVNIIQPVWQGIQSAIDTAWKWIDTNVFTPMKTGIDAVGKAFDAVGKFIGEVWTNIQNAAREPVKFLIDTVWNDGIRSFAVDVLEALGLNDIASGLPRIPMPFAEGGVLPGYTPGRDVHEFYSPTGGRLALSGGEAIMRPEFTKAVGGAAGVARLNSMARNGQAFADGGVFGEMGNFAGDVWDNIAGAASVAWEFITDPVGAVKKHMSGFISGMGGDGAFSEIVAGVPKTLLRGFESFFGSAAPKGVGTAGMGWQAMWQIIQNAAPGLRMTSNYRPGATTVNGGKSYHGSGRAIDLIPASMATFDAVARLFPNASELIYTPAGDRQLLNGRPFAGWSDAVKRQHYNHVHLAMAQGGVVPKLYDQGGWLPHGGLAVNRTGKPEAVLTPDESKALKNGMGKTVNLTFVNPVVKDTLSDAWEAAQMVGAGL